MSELHETPPAPHDQEQNATTGQQTERRATPENAESLIDRLTPQPVARLFAAHEDENAFDPDHTLPEEKARLFAGDNIDTPPPTAEIAADSYEARKEQTRGNKTLEQKIKDWKEGMNQSIDRWGQSPQAETIGVTLKSLGIDKENNDQTIEQQLDTFREKYVPAKEKNESDASAKKRAEKGLEQFAKDMAKGCRMEENGPIDLEKFNKRLNASHELLAIFGTKDNADMKVKYYATAYALADEHTSTDTKDQAKDKIADHLQHKVTDSTERSILAGLHKRHQQLEQERQQPPAETTKQDEEQKSSNRESQPSEGEQEQNGKDQFITTTRLEELQGKITEFLTKDKNTITEEDLTQIKSVLSEYLKGSHITEDEEQFKDILGQYFQKEGVQQIMDKIIEAWRGETPSFYAYQAVKNDDGKIEPNFSLNENIPTLLSHENLGPMINDLLEQTKAHSEESGEHPQGLEMLTASRLHEIIDELQEFTQKTETNDVTDEDKEQIGSLFNEYLTGVQLFSEEKYRDLLKDKLPENKVQELITSIKEAYGGSDPAIGYAIRAIDNDGQPTLDLISDNQNIPMFMKNEKLAEIIQNTILAQMPPEAQQES